MMDTNLTKDEKLLWQSLNALEFASDYLDALSEKMFGGPKKPKNGSTSWHVQQAIAALRERLRETPNAD